MSGKNKKRVHVIGSERNEERRFPESRKQAFHLHGNSCRPESTDRVTSVLLQFAAATKFLAISVTSFRCFVL